jgi:menaquinone-dependent protoporphyrinogen IX oxidase
MHSHTGIPPDFRGRRWPRPALRLLTVFLIATFPLQFVHSLAQALAYSGVERVVHLPDPGPSTQPPATSPAWTAESDQAFALFGYAVASAGDVNGDGYDDVIVGAPYYGRGHSNEGAVFVFHGSAAGPGPTAAWTAESDQAFALFGYAVASAGDVNGDGYDDVMVGAPGYDNGRISQGAAFLYQGSASGLETVPSWTAEGSRALALFGNDVASAGDVNGDGYDDVIVGAPGYYDRFDWFEGWSFVYHGSASGLSASANWTAEGNQRGAKFGDAVHTAGDVNGDGYADVIVGAPGYDHGQQNEGRAFVYHGSAAGLSTTIAWTAESERRSAHLGDAVGTAGDVNGDGYDDVVVGAPHYHRVYDRGRSNRGAAFLYHGSPTGPSAAADWMKEGDRARGRFASAVATAGDVNGDGYDDVLIGAPYYDNDGTNEGAAFLYYGTAAGLRETADWATESDQTWALFGNAVNTAGDVNGDANADIVVGAPFYDRGQWDEGRSYLFYGTGNGTTAPVAGFSASPLTGTAPLTVTFSNHSTGATGYLWHFGDDLTAID